MSTIQAITGQVQNTWSKLNSRWKCDAANAFHQQYIVKISETTEAFEQACTNLENISSDWEKQLQEIEQSLANS